MDSNDDAVPLLLSVSIAVDKILVASMEWCDDCFRDGGAVVVGKNFIALRLSTVVVYYSVVANTVLLFVVESGQRASANTKRKHNNILYVRHPIYV